MKIKKVKTMKALKTRLKKTLPGKIAKVIDSYEVFLEKDVPEDAKGFNAHHVACKSAVIHAENLLKLAKWTRDEEIEKRKKEDIENDIWEIIAEAKNEREKNEDCED